MRLSAPVICFAASIFPILCGCDKSEELKSDTPGSERPPRAFVGAEACGKCHSQQLTDWRDSHHAKAMQEANPQTVLGDFADTEFEHFDVTSSFFRRDGGYWVRTDNADGDLQDFEVKYTFGVTPLQQYLVEFPDGRLQVLPTAWDARSQEQGGQRWFHVYGAEYIGPSDPLHWTGREQNWNYMCAECHSTGLEKNYTLATDTFATRWLEINVACEACHGPGSEHIEKARAGGLGTASGFPVDLDDNGGIEWQMNSMTGLASRSEPWTGVSVQPEACGRCHSRRGAITTDYQFGRPLTDTHLPTLLDEYLYYPDGQVQDEVYVYGSFLQSRMYQAGVTCSDCHDPHTAGLKTAGQSSDVCSSCHLPTTFGSAEHHHHATEVVECVDCHMPERTYMVVDPRRDHSFRVPDPTLTVATGSPNACAACHDDVDTQWVVNAVNAWYGGTIDDRSRYAGAIYAGREGRPGANAALLEVINDENNSGIVRGTALTLLAAPLSENVASVIRRELQSDSSLIRIAALRALEQFDPEFRPEMAASLLDDPVRAVRLQAVTTLSPAQASLRQAYRERFNRSKLEFIDAQLANAERPESHINLGNLYAASGEAAKAEQSYLLALRMEPRAIAARINLVDLYRRLQRDVDAEELLRGGIARDETSAVLHHSLGMVLVRSEQPETALAELARAVELDRENSRYTYVYAIALNSYGDPNEAIAVLENARTSFPADFDIAWALVTLYRDASRKEDAKAEANRLLEQYPGHQRVRMLLDSLEPIS